MLYLGISFAMASIHKKKIPYPVSACLQGYLQDQDREKLIPVTYADLVRFKNSFTLYDKYGKDSLWETVLYTESASKQIHQALKEVHPTDLYLEILARTKTANV